MNDLNVRIWRKVVSYEERLNPGWEKSWAVGGSNLLLLECGHRVRKKISAGVPKKALCNECKTLKCGATKTRTFPDGRREVETWDDEKQWPKKIMEE